MGSNSHTNESEGNSSTALLLSGNVTVALRRMTVPMLLGMVAMIAVNLVDIFWVAKLGTDALAAMSFTFPIQSLVINISIGLLVGTSVVVAQAVGAGRARRSA